MYLRINLIIVAIINFKERKLFFLLILSLYLNTQPDGASYGGCFSWKFT